MKKYRITVNGKTFDVDVEETGLQESPPLPLSAPLAAATPTVASPAASTPAVKPATAPANTAPPTVPKPGVSSGAMVMKSPLPGKILKVLATPGSSWKKGDTLLIIEAMKMENEILAPRDCTVEEVAVEANQTVKTGDVLLKLI
ncbi:MAG: acetyl-CoA carboxylase biotin carboxyl carrier protein subunit [Candidatus Cryosericum sp.]|nr:acetyl-CoA carboxylase biotin carboxyl carrier protein subunit [bacterium]